MLIVQYVPPMAFGTTDYEESEALMMDSHAIHHIRVHLCNNQLTLLSAQHIG